MFVINLNSIYFFFCDFSYLCYLLLFFSILESFIFRVLANYILWISCCWCIPIFSSSFLISMFFFSICVVVFCFLFFFLCWICIRTINVFFLPNFSFWYFYNYGFLEFFFCIYLDDEKGKFFYKTMTSIKV